MDKPIKGFMKLTDRTLLEQMQISDLEIRRRLALLGLNSEKLGQLTRHKVWIEQNIDSIVDEFYNAQTSIDEIALLIGDADTLFRLRNSQRQYILDLFSGLYDSDYVNNRLRIGLVHKRIGVEPKLYLSAVSALKDLIFKTIQADPHDYVDVEQSCQILDKLIYFDTTLVFDTYIDSLVSEIESAKQKTEEYAASLETIVAERTQQLKAQATLDPLTKVYNRRAMQDALRKELASAKRHQTELSLIYFDIDDFKAINDKLGHIKGDEVLEYVGNVLLHSVREVDTPCRYGGDEFCLILPECNLVNARMICEKIVHQFTEHYPDFHLSIGVVTTGPEAYVNGEALIKQADERMYEAKKIKGSKIRY